MPAGRPRKYKTPDEMQPKIDAYFATITDDNPPTVTGLAIALDMTRFGLLEYEERGEFSHTVKKAKARVEAFMEKRMYGNAVAGVIFNLKNNFGWKDKQEIEHGVTSDLATLMEKIDGRTRGIPQG